VLHAVHRAEEVLQASGQENLLEARVLAGADDICLGNRRSIHRLGPPLQLQILVSNSFAAKGCLKVPAVELFVVNLTVGPLPFC
jgi:hypothetical protein